MPKYILSIAADHTGTAHRIELEAATPWLALEKSRAQLGWLGAELFEGARSLGRVEYLPLCRKGLWQLMPPGEGAQGD